MKKNVLGFEPELALFVNDKNPLKYFQEILNFSKIFLKPKGFLFFEINQNLYVELVEIIDKNHYSFHKLFYDFNNKPRFLVINN